MTSGYRIIGTLRVARSAGSWGEVLLDAAEVARIRARAWHLSQCAPTSVDDGMAWMAEMLGMIDVLIAEIARRDRAAMARWNADAESYGPLFRKKGGPQ